jgi:hypothetical protein
MAIDMMPGFGAFTSSASSNVQTILADATGVFSTRKVISGYSGFAMEISNGTTYLDVGFSGNDLDTSAITTYLAGSEGYVVRMYNQAGSGSIASGGPSDGPRICLSGTIATKNGKACPQYVISRNNYLKQTSSAILSGDSLYTISIVASAESDSPANGRIMSLCAGGDSDDFTNATALIPCIYQSSEFRHIRGASAGTVAITPTTGVLTNVICYQDASNIGIIKDGGTAVTTAVTPTALASSPSIALGVVAISATTCYIGYIGEVVIWERTLTPAERATVNDDVSAYWGTA